MFSLLANIKRFKKTDIALSCRACAMGEMAAALAHEINQPLTVIAAYSQSCLSIIENESLKNDKLLIPLQKIAAQAKLAGEIIHNMKDFIRNRNFVVEETDINLLIQDTVTIFHYELLDFKLKITLNLMNNLPQIMTNKIHIMQVILNLARNSTEALQDINTPNPELIIETTRSHNTIRVDVRDNGPGIPAEYKDKVLNTYFTTKPQGTGIGLGICRKLIEEHGGTLCLQDTPQKGTWFTFTLPLT